MSANKIVPGAARQPVRSTPSIVSGLRINGERAPKVARRRAEYDWGSPLPRRVDWGLAWFIVWWTAAMSAVAIVGSWR